jgi:hypothetical protein
MTIQKMKICIIAIVKNNKEAQTIENNSFMPLKKFLKSMIFSVYLPEVYSE